MTFILNLILPIFIAVVTAWFTVRFSLKQFYSQKWWEKRWEAYVTIIECLHHMKRLFSVEIECPKEAFMVLELEDGVLAALSGKVKYHPAFMGGQSTLPNPAIEKPLRKFVLGFIGSYCSKSYSFNIMFFYIFG